MRSSLVSVAIKAVSLALVIVVSVLMARCMGAVGYGRFAFMQSIAFVLGSFATLGFRESANRMVARYVVKQKRILLSRFILFGVTIITLTSALLAAIGHGVIVHLPELAGKYEFPLSTLFGMVATFALLSFLAPVLVALGRPVLSFTVENIVPRLIMLTAVVAVLAAGTRLEAGAALDLTVIGNLVPATFLAIFSFVRF
ncbi:MAG: oligosaccharide flippase family protein, partial [Acetobacteraceae bacterium]|nr:oligosaccharide flippase family protein [Acetobacteraceae bacterium]